MTDTNETPPVEVNASPIPDQLWAALRQIAPPVATFALGKGWIDNDMLILLTALAGVIWPILAGQLKTRHRATQLANVAADPRVPDEGRDAEAMTRRDWITGILAAANAIAIPITAAALLHTYGAFQ